MPHETSATPGQGPGPTRPPVVAPAPGSFLEGVITEAKRLALLPVTTLREEAGAGAEQFEAGAGALVEGRPKGLIDLVIGAARGVASPLTASVRTVADPASRVIQSVTGVSEETRAGMQTGTELGLALFAPAALSRALAEAPPAAQLAAGVLAGVPVGASVPRSLAARGARALPLTESRVATATTGRIAEAAEAALQGNLDTSKRLFRNVTDALGAGEIAVESLPEVLRKYGVSSQEFAQFYAETVSNSGRTLNQLSQLRQRLQAVFADEPAAAKVLEALGSTTPEAAMGSLQSLGAVWRRLDNSRRALLVSQWSTAIRNAWSQAGRYTLDMADSTLTSLFEGRGFRESIRDGVENLTAVARKLSSEGRDRLARILDEFPLEAQKLSGTIAGEATLGSKLSNFINPLNRAQEGFFRSIAFDSKLRQLARHRGLDLDQIAAREIPGELIQQATKHALDITFAATPEAGTIGARILGAYRELPVLTTINPFPRFTVNALTFLWEFSPARLLSPTALKTIAHGSPEEAARVMSRAMIGTANLSMALAIRGSETVGGEKWYEIKVPGTDRRIDTRAFGPFNLYLLLAEALVHPDRVNVADLAKGLVSINRVGGTGLIITDALREGLPAETLVENFYSFVGQYFGGFGVPFRNLQAAIQVAGSEDASTAARTFRDVRDRPLIDPFLANVPGVSTTLPERRSPLKAEVPVEEAPALRLFGGLSVKTKNAVEQEVDRLNIPFRSILPGSGIPEWDRAITAKMGPLVEKELPAVLTSEPYRKADKPMQRILLKAVLSAARRDVMPEVVTERPDLFVQVKLKGLDPDIRELLEVSRKGVPARFPKLLEQLKGGALR